MIAATAMLVQASPQTHHGRRKPVNLRSLLLGIAGVVFICGLTPFNDYVLANTFFVGNFLPIGLLLFLLVVILAINAPLLRWVPRHALSSGELAVALGMMLVSSSLPSSGLMRYLVPNLVSPWSHAASNADYQQTLDALNLPDWLFPTFASSDTRARGSDPVVAFFMNRIPGVEDSMPAKLAAVPWSAWARPAITWGIFCAALFAAVICGTIIVRHQWVENERLAFPLAGVYLSLIETPPPGRAFNTLFRSPGFWIAGGVIFVIHSVNALSQYAPRIWPQIPIAYDMSSIFSSEPWNYMEPQLKRAQIYFCILGITFFLRTNTALSLWAFYVMTSVVTMRAGTLGTEFSVGMRDDQRFGALLPFALAILWVGRRHWRTVAAQMFRSPRPGEPQGLYLPYRFAGWGLMGSLGLMMAWLIFAGTTAIGAAVIVCLTMTVYLVLARVVAETGLIFVQIMIPGGRPWVYAVQELAEPIAFRTTLKNYFYSSFIYNTFAHDIRESLPVFSTHAVRVADVAAYEEDAGAGSRIQFVASLVIALVVGYLVAGTATLYTEYAHQTTLSREQSSPINPYGVDVAVKYQTLDPTSAYRVRNGQTENHNRLLHFGIGATVTSLLSFLQLRYVSWPLHPLGFLLAYSYPISMMWFSIFLGWLAKVVIIRFGGTEVLRSARPVFIGMIIGEAGAAAFWLVTSLVLHSLGFSYHSVVLMPG